MTKELLTNLSYSEQVAYHKGAFASLMCLKYVIENMQTGINRKLFTKKAYKLINSYLDEAIKNIDEFLAYQGMPYGIIDRYGNYKRVSDIEAALFIAANREKYQNKDNSLS